MVWIVSWLVPWGPASLQQLQRLLPATGDLEAELYSNLLIAFSQEDVQSGSWNHGRPVQSACYCAAAESNCLSIARIGQGGAHTWGHLD